MVSNNRIERLWQHWRLPTRRIKQWFPQATLARLERMIGESEAKHIGQIRFVIESNMETMAVLKGVTPRQRARQYFGSLEVWDTAYNTGVLLYVSCADRAIEIVADRALDRTMSPEQWQTLISDMQSAFQGGHFSVGLVTALERVSQHLKNHFPRKQGGEVTADNLPDAPVVRHHLPGRSN